MDRTKFRFRNLLSKNTFWRRVFKAGLLASLVGGLSVGWSVQAGILPQGFVWLAPVLTNAAEESKENSDDLATREARAISLLMYRDRDRERLLFHARDQLMEGNLNAGLDYLQRILDFEEDLFIWRKSDGQLVSLRSEADQLLMSLDAASFQRYQRLADAEAGALYKRAKENTDPRLHQEVTRRYFHTTHGFKATHWLAIRWFDHGDFQLAARAWKSLEAHPYHRSDVTRLMRAKREMAEKLSRKPSTQPQPLLRVASTYPTSTGSRLDVIPASATESKTPLRSSWRGFQGGSDRAESVAATTPFLNPDWAVSYSENPSRAVSTALTLWEEKQGKALRSRATALFPIVVEDSVLFRDFEGIRCIDRVTGALQWSFRSRSSLQAEMNDLDAKHGADGVQSSRSGNYVQAQAAYAENSVLGLLSSDGQRVYAVDEMVLDLATSQSSATADPRKCNKLIALPIHPKTAKEIQPLWSVGGIATNPSAEPVLVGHFFRGPPLPMDGRLFAITECRGQINLVSLEAETGKLIWKQGIAFADDTSDINPDRYPLACPIAFGNGILVCPTQTGLLVGVEAITGNLLWSYCYAEELYKNENHGWRDRFRKTWGSDGFPAAPKVLGRHVVLLPRQSGEIHCLDLESGRRIWTVPREDGEYIGAVTDSLVFIVGQRYCRGLSLSSGEENWSARFGLPAGQGIHANGQYLLPLESGRIATIDLNNGREIGLSGWRNSGHFTKLAGVEASDLTSQLGLAVTPLPENWHTGNLIPAGDRILAAGPSGLIAFPQTGELLNRTVRNRLLDSPNDLPTRLLAAELHLNLGQFGPARRNLETVLAPNAEQRLRPQGEFLMRELLFRQLETEPNFAQPLLDDLAALVSTPADKGRFLMRKADYQLRIGNPLGAWETARALIALDYDLVLPWPRNPQHVISPGNYVIRLMQTIREDLNAEQLAVIDQHVEATFRYVIEDGRPKVFRQFLAIYGAWPQAAGVRQQLALHAKEAGRFQQAEFYWLKNRDSRDPVVVAEANRQLMNLWNQLGLYSEAAMLAEELASARFESLPLMDGKNVQGLLAEVSNQSLLGHAIGRRSLPSYAIDRVEITEQRWAESSLAWTWETIELNHEKKEQPVNAFAQYRREFPLTPGSSFQLLDKGWVDESGEHAETRVAVINRASGVIQGKVRIPLRNSYPSLSKRAHVGHYFPVGGINSMAGVSLLELEDEQPLWKTKLGDEAAHQHLLRVGPAGAEYCTFQGQQELIVLDPATGQTLWKRSDIDPSSGLVSDPYAGLFGDENVLVMFDSNRSSYTVFSTMTGEDLHHGKLDIDTGQIRRIFGRKLFYITGAREGRRMRIWDFGENRLVFDEPAGPRVFTALTPDQNLAVVIPPEPGKPDQGDVCQQNSRLQILDVVNGKRLLNLSIPSEDVKNLNYIRAFEHGGTYYVNLQRSVQMPVERLFSYYASDAFPPVENIQGDLIAVDPATGEIKWERTLPQRSILQMPHLRLPFLVMISRVRDRWQGGKQGLLVEIVDAQTGETIARKDNNLSDRLVNLAYDREKGILDLNGLKTRIRLKFGPAVSRIPDRDGPI